MITSENKQQEIFAVTNNQNMKIRKTIQNRTSQRRSRTKAKQNQEAMQTLFDQRYQTNIKMKIQLEQVDMLIVKYQIENCKLNKTIEDNRMNQLLLLAQMAAIGMNDSENTPI